MVCINIEGSHLVFIIFIFASLNLTNLVDFFLHLASDALHYLVGVLFQLMATSSIFRAGTLSFQILQISDDLSVFLIFRELNFW